MKIAVLSRNPRLYSTRRLVEAGTERGHEMVVIDTLRAYMNIASHKPQIHYRGKPLEGFDAVIPRIGASVTFYGCAVLRQFEMMGCSRSTNRWPSPVHGTSCVRCNCCRGAASVCR